MSQLTLRVIDGADRGRTFPKLAPPISIGREEGNTIQLNDERVSRFHLKIQEDHEKLVLTDLESTNGTKVNGEDIQLRILRLGDMISVGRSVLLVGSREEIAARFGDKGENSNGNGIEEEEGTIDPEGYDRRQRAHSLDFEVNSGSNSGVAAIPTALPPGLPERLSPGQAAQLCEVLEYIHGRIRPLVASVAIEKRADKVTIDAAQWHHLLDLQARLAEYLRRVGDPGE